MSVTSKLASILGAFKTYGPTAIQAAGEIETTVGAGNGKTKAAMLTGVLLSIFHAGELVPIPQVALISALGDMVVGVLNARGELGKPAPAAIQVPASTTPPIL